MRYCENCHLLVSGLQCPGCGTDRLRNVKPTDFCFVTEKDEMWAKMFLEILKDNDIPYTQLSSVGAGLAIRAGVTDQIRIYVPYEKLDTALDLLKQAFPDD